MIKCRDIKQDKRNWGALSRTSQVNRQTWMGGVWVTVGSGARCPLPTNRVRGPEC